MYIAGIFTLSAKDCIPSIMKFNFITTDNKIITPAVIATKFAISGLSFFITRQSMVETIAIPTNCITSKISPPL